jgi:hypothetical protein
MPRTSASSLRSVATLRSVKLRTSPPPPPNVSRPGRATSMLLPSLDRSSVTFCVVPLPMVTMAITALTPMTMPRSVRIERSTLRRTD